jgi:hypothetical protein
MKRVLGVVGVSAVSVAVAVLVGVQLAPAEERGDLDRDARGGSSLEFVGRAEQVGPNITIFGYVTHVVALDDASLFAPTNPPVRNETNARISFQAHTTISQAFQVLPPPDVSSLFDVDSSGTLIFYFREAPSGRTFSNPSSFATGAPVASYALHFQDVVAALVGVDPTRGVVDSNGELCQQSAVAFNLQGERRILGHPGAQQHVFTHGWTVRTSPQPPQSFTHFGGHTDSLREGRC